MAPSPRKGGPQAYPAALALTTLRNCLVNLPQALVDVLIQRNWVVQNVIVELAFTQAPTKPSQKPVQRSVYVGWTGQQSKRRAAAALGRDGFASRGVRPQDEATVEIDATFAKLLGLAEGQKIGVLLYPDPPQCDVVNVEPSSAADWEIMELHANFLELNMLSQIRALPNPAYKSPTAQPPQPLTLHLSPTSTANVVVTSLTPAPGPEKPFAKISPNAEVIVAPRTRAKTAPSMANEGKTERSVDGRSAASTSRTRSRRHEAPQRQAVFLRGVHRRLGAEWFDDKEETDKDTGLKVWVDWSILTSKEMRGVTWVSVSIVRPAGLQAPQDPQQAQDQAAVRPAGRVIAQVCAWEEAPDSRHVAVSSLLSSILDMTQEVGETIRLEAAPTQTPRGSFRTLKISPFPAGAAMKSGFQFGHKSRNDREEAARRILQHYRDPGGPRLLDGAITDGMIVPPFRDASTGGSWPGGILRFEPTLDTSAGANKAARAWFLGAERKILVKTGNNESDASGGAKLILEVSADAISPPNFAERWAIGDKLPSDLPSLVGIDNLLARLTDLVKHGSSALLTGGRGSGKSAVAQAIARNMNIDAFAHTTYLSCNSLSTDETRVSAVKETLQRVFGLASWGARHGGNALVILDDLDAICPAETELQTSDNGRSRQIAEIVVSLTKQYCTTGSRVVLIATSKSKEDTNNVIIGGHVVRDILNIPAPDKETRRNVLSEVCRSEDQGAQSRDSAEDMDSHMVDTTSPDLSEAEDDKPGLTSSPALNTPGFLVDPTVDFLDIAGHSDGFMPGDLLLLASRARSEAIIRSTSSSELDQAGNTITLIPADFDAALKGFTPSSLRNVTLQHSSTTFSSIGGLRSTRQTLLETLQYPTLYAPIFSKCPLRLRSGLLLYGYPGCGKTLLASAVAGECGLNFISVKGPEILNKYIGASEKSVRDLFERAQAARPCVLFFDEFDSVAPKRGHDSTGVTDRVVNQLLTQMDGAEGLSGVYVLAATSRPDLIDPALLRPGRLDKSLMCDMPDTDDRLDILRALSGQLRMAPSLLSTSHSRSRNLEEVARRTQGYSGADLQAVVYNAHLEAIHDVLNKRDEAGAQSSKSSSKSSAATSKNIPDFTYFRYGNADTSGTQTPSSTASGSASLSNSLSDPPLSAAARIAERAHIAEQLTAHKTAQARLKAERRGLGSSQRDSDSHKKIEEKTNQEPMIEWTHLERSLAQTRPSISRDERRRLERIYREFVVGRNGEMPSGQGGSEVGGRSSLM